jgi:ribosomal protein S12 methylthiotransferase
MNEIASTGQGAATETTSSAAPKVGFVSLGCPKALTDSELILTQLSAEGYQTSKTFEGADLVIVNTCGFIDDAVKESLDTISEALNVNGKVIVTGCLGAKEAEGGGNMVPSMRICPSRTIPSWIWCPMPLVKRASSSHPVTMLI